MKDEEGRFRSFSFLRPEKGKLSAMLKRSSADVSVSRHRKVERNVYEQESHSETLFNELSRYKLLFDEKNGSKRTKNVRKSVSPRRSVLKKSVSPLRGERWEQQDEEAEYAYQSPKEMIKNLNEQMRRNKGRYGSLLDFAQKNGLDVHGRVFANCEESGDVLEPKIDLEKELEEALRATSLH